MFACRSAWLRCGSLARAASYRRPPGVLLQRQMSSAPGGSGENIVYTVLCAGAFVGAISYAYSTVTSDSARYNDRIAEISARPKTDWTPKPWPPKSADEDTGADGDEEDEVVADIPPSEEEPESVLETVDEVATIAEEVAEAAQEVDTLVEVPEADVAVAKPAEPVPIAAEEPEINAVQSIGSSVGAPKEEMELIEDEARGHASVAKNLTEETPVLLLPVEEASIQKSLETHKEQESQSLVEVSSVGSESVVEVDPVEVQVEVPVERFPESEELPVEAAPITEEISLEAANATMDGTQLLEVLPVHMASVAAEVPGDIAQVSEEPHVAPLMMVTIEVPQMVQETLGEVPGMAKEACLQVPPVAEEAPINTLQVVATPSTDVPSSNEVVAMQDSPTQPQKEYIVVVLEGKPKAEQRPKVLGVGPLSESIAGPDDASE